MSDAFSIILHGDNSHSFFNFPCEFVFLLNSDRKSNLTIDKIFDLIVLFDNIWNFTKFGFFLVLRAGIFICFSLDVSNFFHAGQDHAQRTIAPICRNLIFWFFWNTYFSWVLKHYIWFLKNIWKMQWELQN